ncbi:WD40 repeat-like protein [Dendrothele bispora CBS 962.96]|uniref:Elongator complex protein 2 n=1 Tax=Dendrothele bispora (strain CBS 962.96) TaxID=1314807 RepID=A0A4S8MYY2_DENBC|nr:WD40 repeat-like protein [Dendrothele bispora CBS 962.96]
MDVSTAYIAASANRHSNAVDVNPSSTLFFGSSNLIALWDVTTDKDEIVETLHGHESTVTCIRVVDGSSFVSADDSGMIHYWTKTQNDSQWKSICKLQAHQKAVSSLCVLKDCLATGSSDGTVKLWKLTSPNSGDIVVIKEVQTISLSGRYPQALAFAFLPQSKSMLLAIGGTNKNVQLWTCSDENSPFIRSATLSGHEDWVRGLDFRTSSDSGVLILASGSQDATIRLWNIETYKKESLVQGDASKEPLSDDLLDAFEESLGDFADAEEGGRQISLKRHIISIKSSSGSSVYSVTFDALLVGHEAGITSISWRPTSQNNPTPTLMSSSTDSSVILWSPSSVINRGDESASIWINRQRFGDVGGQRLGGFIGGIWNPDGSEVIAWGWSGGWRRWRCASIAVGNGEEEWEETGAVGGHSGPVKNLCWCPSGAYLASTGLDQTTRVHGPVTLNDGKRSWHELARPQVHGYDLLGVSFFSDTKFASIADEKVVRVFEAPRRFIDLAENLGVAQFPETEKQRPMGASVPPLGLSNKASETNSSSHTASVPVDRRPFEGELASTTLWPEIEKVYGHGYESISIASSSSRKYVATACKATTPEHAVVRIYDTSNWHLVGDPLPGHSLTVTRIAFSPDDQYVLTVSRDRSWRIHRAQEGGGYAPFAAEAKAHARIIWDCAWAHEDDIFATASRDKTVKIWRRDESGKWQAVTTIKTAEAATAVDFTSYDKRQKRRLLAIGMENGHISIYSNTGGNTWSLELSLDSSKAHVNHITRLSWRPQISPEDCPRELATCSEDSTLRILIVRTD